MLDVALTLQRTESTAEQTTELAATTGPSGENLAAPAETCSAGETFTLLLLNVRSLNKTHTAELETYLETLQPSWKIHFLNRFSQC